MSIKSALDIFERLCVSSSIHSYSEGKSKIIKLTFKQLIDLKDEHVLILPIIQTDLSGKIVDEMTASYKKYPHHLGSRCLITIAKIQELKEDKPTYYLMDGQHRINMSSRLYTEDYRYNETLLVAVIQVETMQEFEVLFDKINKDSAKCTFSKLPSFDRTYYKILKEKFIIKYGHLAPKATRIDYRVYTISEFIDQIIPIIPIIINIIKTDDAMTIYKYLLDKEAYYFDKIGYIEKLNTNKTLFKPMEAKCIEAKCALLLKLNNIIEWICIDEYMYDYDYNYNYNYNHRFIKYKNPTAKQKKETWKIYYGTDHTGKCMTSECINILDNKNNPAAWHCSHIISDKNGGISDVSNFIPLCATCNLRMGSNDIIIHK